MSAPRPSRPRSGKPPTAPPALEIQFSTPCRAARLDRTSCRRLLRRIAADHEISAGEISVAVVDVATIQRLHAEYLDDDTPTDVLSFVLTRRGDWLEGEIVACADVARQVAAGAGTDSEAELLLYIVHGMLHLVGYDDLTARDSKKMRERELFYAGQTGGALCAGKPRSKRRSGR